MLSFAGYMLSLMAGLVAVPVVRGVPMLGSRAPHFATVIAPEAGQVILFNSSSPLGNNTAAQVQFTYSNGERAEESTVSVFLANLTTDGDVAEWPVATEIPFYDSYFVNATLNFNSSFWADGNYTFVALEIYQGDITAEIILPIGISHDASAVPPTGEETTPPFSSWSSTILIPTSTAQDAGQSGISNDINVPADLATVPTAT